MLKKCSFKQYSFQSEEFQCAPILEKSLSLKSRVGGMMVEKTLAMHREMHKTEKAFESLSSLFYFSDCSYSIDMEREP